MAAVPLVLGHLRFYAECPAVAALLGFCTWLTQVGWPTPAVDVFVGLVGSWYSTWFSTLCQRGFPFHCFPLAGSAPSPFCCLPFAGAAPFRAPVCGSTSAVGPCGWVGGVFAASLGLLPCAVLFLRACSLRSFPSCRLPWSFPVTGCLSFCFPGDLGWA